MADLISRQAVLAKSFDIGGFSNVVSVYDVATLPAVDAVEVVRCKDCIRCGFCGEATNLEVMGFYGYCSRGKRREENEA